MKKFVFEFMRTMHDSDDSVLEAHQAWCRRLEAEEKLVLAGTYDDGSGFLVILRVVDRLAGESLVRAHPWVVAGMGSWTVREWTQSDYTDETDQS